MMEIRLKRTDSTDIDFQNLVIKLDSELWNRYPDTQQNFAPFNHANLQMKVVIAYFSNRAVGCGCFKPFSKTGSVEIKRMYVEPLSRGHKIGLQILTELENWAREESITLAVLETGVNQPEAITLYERSGYKRIPNYPPYEMIADSICMVKELR